MGKKKTSDRADFIYSWQGGDVGEKDSLSSATAMAVNRNSSRGIREDCKNRNNITRSWEREISCDVNYSESFGISETAARVNDSTWSLLVSNVPLPPRERLDPEVRVR